MAGALQAWQGSNHIHCTARTFYHASHEGAILQKPRKKIIAQASRESSIANQAGAARRSAKRSQTDYRLLVTGMAFL